MLYTFCGPSGAGKSTLLAAVLLHRRRLRRLVTVTTRAPRPSEAEGREYHFVSEARFQQERDAGLLVGAICYRGACYATRYADLCSCQQIDTIGILHPAELPSLARFTPLFAIYIERVPSPEQCSGDDRSIQEARHLCQASILNVWGSLEQATHDLLALLPKESLLCVS